MGGKFYGAVGYVKTVETVPGVHQEEVTEINYTGDILKNASKWRDGENLNSDLVLDNKLSIVADLFAYTNFHLIRYVVWMGVKWQVTSVDVARPRLNLIIGGVYNGSNIETPGIPSDSY